MQKASDTLNKTQIVFRTLRMLDYPAANARKALHKLTGITQPYLAARLNLTRSYISQVMDGKRRCSEVQEKIAEIYGVPVDEFFEDARKKEVKK